MNSKIKFTYIGVLIALCGIILSKTYRVYIYSHGLYDFHLADTIGSLLCVPAGACFFYGLSSGKSFESIVLYILFGNVLYELFAITSWHGVFDWYDLIAIIIGTLFTLGIASTDNLRKHLIG